jgi:hypothetical protein
MRAACALLLVAFSACGGDEGDGPAARGGSGDLPTVEVAPAPDARVDVGGDVKERRRTETFSGVLPTGFPRAMPLPPQATLVDQGGGWIEVLVPRQPAAVRAPYLQQLRAAGWEVTPTGADAWRCSRAETSVRLTLRAQGPSTRLRLAY